MSILHNEQVKLLRLKALKGEADPRLSSPRKTPFNLSEPRLVNGFSLGCDPEFLLLGREGNSPLNPWRTVSASSCGLRVDEAFGMDGAGTPVELRAHPSRFALEVTASLLNTLRWMFLQNRNARNCHFWAAGSYLHRLALGGHVHLGRKAGVRDLEIKALNSLCAALEKAGFFRDSETRRKESGYGNFGDYRKQAWGYEYRSYGCFLFSPSTSHLLLTLTKLAVLDPEISAAFGVAGKAIVGVEAILATIHNILSFYRFLDDDASIAFRGLGETFLGRGGETNILKRWGLAGGYVPENIQSRMSVVPSTIPADFQALIETAESIFRGQPPPFRVPETTWVKLCPPPIAPNEVFAIRPSDEFYLGEREIVHGLYGVYGSGLAIHSARNTFPDKCLELSFDFLKLLSNEEYRRVKEVQNSLGASLFNRSPRQSKLEIGIGRGLRQNASLRAIKHLLESGILPVADSKHATREWCEMWKRRLRKVGLYQ